MRDSTVTEDNIRFEVEGTFRHHGGIPQDIAEIIDPLMSALETAKKQLYPAHYYDIYDDDGNYRDK